MPGEYVLRYYVTARGKRPFPQWLCSLGSREAVARIQVRLERIRLGNFGDVRALGGGLSELRIDMGPGYRVYFTVAERLTIVLLCGGAKGTQDKDIRLAREYLSDYRSRRTDA
jgi:putative addiction module killer protein